MIDLTIYTKDGEERFVGQSSVKKSVQPSITYSGTWMGESFVTLNITSAYPIDFEIGDYIIYRDEKFVINYDPTVVKKARSGSYDEGFTYKDVKFNSLSFELTDIKMLDYVIDDNNLHYTGLPNFSFYCSTIDDLADRLQVNANRYCAENEFDESDYWFFITPNKNRTLQRFATNSLKNAALAIWNRYFDGIDSEDQQAALENEKVNQNITIDNLNVWDSCKFIKDTFGLNFINRGRNVVIGAVGIPTSDVFQYGKGKGLYEIERYADSDQAVITKLFAYGSEKNLPVRYYANLGLLCYGDVESTDSSYYDINVDFSTSYFTGVPTSGEYAVKIRFSENEYNAVCSVNGTTGRVRINVQASLTTGSRIYFIGGVDKDKWPSDRRQLDSNISLPNNMSVSHLMLPGFPTQSLYDWVLANGGSAQVPDNADFDVITNSDRYGIATWRGHTAYFSKDKYQPFILSKYISKLGIRESTKIFDGSDGDDEIYATIKDTGFDKIVSAEKINDNGVFGEDVNINNFDITIPDLGSDFDFSSLLQTDTVIEMTDGYCGGRSFAVKSVSQNQDGTWKCNCERCHDTGLDLWFPYSFNASMGNPSVANEPYQIRTGDSFVITGIEMTSTYINANAVKLLESSLVFLEKNEYVRYTYSPKIDELFMARQNDIAKKEGTRSYYKTIKEGDTLLFSDEDIGIDGSIFIDTLRIKEYGNSQIPSYELTLRNDKEVGTIERIQEQINSITTNIQTNVGNLNTSQIRNLIAAYGVNYFLSKVSDDTENGFITFVKGLRSKLLAQLEGGAQFGENGSYAITSTGDATLDDIIASTLSLTGNANIRGILSAASAIINSLTSTEITTERLTVTKAAHFFSLIIDELRSVGGSIILTAANATVDIKETTQAGDYRLLWRATDGEKRIRNQFISGDGVICMTFNESDVSGYNISNKYYWMRCIDSGVTNRTENDEDVLYNYIVLSSSEKDPDGTSIPEVGDKIVQLGYNGLASDSTQRQSAIILAAYNSPDAGLNAPMFAHYSGIDDFNLTSHRKTYIALQGSEFVGTFRVLAQDGTYINIVDRLNSIVSDIDTIKNQTDGLMVIYFGYGVPTLNNEPASTWNTSEYASHVGDVYYDKTKNPGDTGGRAWQWGIKNNVYQWIEITDSYTIEALERAAAAQAAAAVKIRCFATTPYPPYDVNDLWIADNGEVKVCVNAKAQGELFNESDWVLKVGSEDYRSFYERLYNVNPSAFDNNSRGYIDILKGTAHSISDGNFYYNVDSNNNITKLYQAQESQFVEITDEAAIEAVQMALSSYDLRTEYMRRIFLNTPVVPYTAGNIYVKKFNVYNPLSRETLAMGRDIYVCTKTRTNSESYQATDWLRVSISSAAEFNVLSNQIRGLVYDQNNTSLLLLTSKAINILNTFFTSDADGKNATVKSGGLVVQEGISSLIAEEVRNQVGDDIATKAELTVAANEIKANIASQKYNSNLFGFTDGLSFTDSCVPFIQAYGVEIVGNSVGTITGFGGKSVDGVTISFDARTMSGTTILSIGVNGTVVGTVSDVSATWQRKTITADNVTILNSISASYSTSGIATVVLRNIKVESGSIATSFCISDNDGKELESTNMYSTTVDYNKDPIFMKINANETIDTSDADGHGNVLTFYRNNSSDPPFMLYNDYIGWSDDPRTKVFTAGKVYTISFWAKAAVSGLKIHTGLYGHVTTAAGESSTVSYTTHNSGAYYSDKLTDGVYDNGGGECIHSLTTSWKRYYARFYIQTGVTAIPIIQCNNGLSLGSEDSVYLYIADVRLEEGYIADDSDPMSISGAQTRSEAKFNLTADNIKLKLNNTGIDIENNKITLDAANTQVSGNFTAKKVNTTDVGNGRIAMEGGLMQVYNSIFANPQIVFGVDENGNIVLRYYDANGNVLWDLGPKGLSTSASQDEEIRTYTNWCIPKTWYNGSWQQSWGDSDLYMIESYCDSQYASSTESFVARILNRGLATELGLVYQYDARIVLGNFQAGNYSDSEETAEVYNKLFLNHSPSSSSSGKLTSTYNSSTGKYEPKAEWTATFMRIVRAEIWRTPYSMGSVTYDERTGKYYAVPDDYIDERELEHGNLVDFEVLYDNGGYVYKDPPVYFYLEIYEYGVFKESGVWYINSSNVYGL